VALLIRAAPSKRDRILIEVAYAGGLRVSEIVNLTWADVLPRENDLVQLSILGKGEKPRQVLLPDIVSRSLLTLNGDAGANDPVFASRKGGRLTARGARDGETHGGKGLRQCCDLAALAATRARFARHR
jgi:integrase/recombinase XerD